MKTEAQIRSAISHFEQTIQVSADKVGYWLMILDVLRWCCGDPSEFDEVIAGWEAVDKARRRQDSHSKN